MPPRLTIAASTAFLLLSAPALPQTSASSAAAAAAGIGPAASPVRAAPARTPARAASPAAAPTASGIAARVGLAGKPQAKRSACKPKRGKKTC
jgi:hypothetical protein